MDEISKMNLHYRVLKFTPFKRQLRRYQSYCLRQFVVHRNARNMWRKTYYGMAADKLGFALTPYAGARQTTDDMIMMDTMMDRLKFLKRHYPDARDDGLDHVPGKYWRENRQAS